MKKNKAALACTVCGSRNYALDLGTKVRTERLEVNKFCKHCGTHTAHKETK